MTRDKYSKLRRAFRQFDRPDRYITQIDVFDDEEMQLIRELLSERDALIKERDKLIDRLDNIMVILGSKCEK